jgi:Holliday junction resolvase
MITLVLPFPDRALSPNSHLHWSRKAKAAKAARQTANWIAREAGIRPNDPDIPAALKVTAIFSPPDNRPRDIDGMLSSLKSALDGIADATGVDDSKWQIAIRKDAPVKGGAVRIELEDIA